MKTEVRNEFILEAHKSACSEWKSKIEKECPELFKTKLEVGKWYKWIDGENVLLWNITEIKNKTIYSYGFYNEDWIDNKITYSKKYYQEACENLKPATEEEVKEALIKEAKKRGLKDGVILKKECINQNAHSVGKPIKGFYFDFNSNTIDSENSCGWIFKDGKWATISNPIEEKINDLQKQIYELKKQL